MIHVPTRGNVAGASIGKLRSYKLKIILSSVAAVWLVACSGFSPPVKESSPIKPGAEITIDCKPGSQMAICKK